MLTHLLSVHIGTHPHPGVVWGMCLGVQAPVTMCTNGFVQLVISVYVYLGGGEWLVYAIICNLGICLYRQTQF